MTDIDWTHKNDWLVGFGGQPFLRKAGKYVPHETYGGTPTHQLKVSEPLPHIRDVTSDTDFLKKTRKELIEFVNQNCVFKPKGRMFGKAPGTRYTSQFYFAAVTHNGHLLKNICKAWKILLLERGIDINDIQIAGRHWSSLPLLGAIAIEWNVNTFSVRRERKNYGQHNLIEGLPNDKPVLLVDDLANSTDSFWFTQDYLVSQNIKVLDVCLCVLNKKNETDGGYLWDKYSNQTVVSIISRNNLDLS